MFAAIESLFRQMTDRKVHCDQCGQFIGYVPLFSKFKRWRHDECPPYFPVHAI